MKRTYRIYKITGPDGRAYIGCTEKPLDVRLRQHFAGATATYRHSVGGIAEAVRAQGRDGWMIECLAMAATPQRAGALEGKLIRQHGTLRPHGMNCTGGGGGVWFKGRGTPRPIAPAERRDIIDVHQRTALLWPTQVLAA